MIRCFRKSRTVRAVVFMISVLLCVAVIWHDRVGPVYIPILACILLLGIGAALSQLIGNFVADRENTRLLSLLHVDLDPEAFINSYRNVPSSLPAGSRTRHILEDYLADGYAAAGDFTNALQVLSEEIPQEDTALAGVREAARASALLYQGKAKEAEASISRLAVIAQDAKNANLSANLSAVLSLLQDRLRVLQGGSVDRSALAAQIDRAPYQLKRLEILDLLAQDAVLHGNPAAANCIKRLHSEAGKTWYASRYKEGM